VKIIRVHIHEARHQAGYKLEFFTYGLSADLPVNDISAIRLHMDNFYKQSKLFNAIIHNYPKGYYVDTIRKSYLQNYHKIF